MNTLLDAWDLTAACPRVPFISMSYADTLAQLTMEHASLTLVNLTLLIHESVSLIMSTGLYAPSSSHVA